VIGDRAVVLAEGDSLYFQADATHTFSNPGRVPCEYFLVIDSSKLQA